MLAEELLACDCAGGGEGEPVFLRGVTPGALTIPQGRPQAQLCSVHTKWAQGDREDKGEHTEYEVG